MLKYKVPDFQNLGKLLNFKQSEFDKLNSIIIKMLEPLKQYADEMKIKSEIVLSDDYDMSIYRKYNINITKDDTPIKLEFDIPELINGCKFYIGKNYWYPINQIRDKCLIIRPDLILFQSNIASFRLKLLKKKNAFTIFIPINNLNISVEFLPLCLGILGVNETMKLLGCSIVERNIIPDTEEMMLREKYQLKIKKNPKDSLKKLLDVFGRITINRNDNVIDIEFWKEYMNEYISEKNKKGNINDIEQYLKNIYDIDLFTRNYMITDSILKEILYAFTVNDIKQIDANNKRIVFVEWILYNIINSVFIIYTQLQSFQKGKKLSIYKERKFSWVKVLDKRLLKYEYEFNQITAFYEQLVLNHIGPLGLEKEYFKGSKRNIHGSQYGQICPVVTPDRENTAVVVSMALGCDLDKLYKDII